jgi:hypothetical protein
MSKANVLEIDRGALARVIGGSSTAVKESVVEVAGRLNSLTNTLNQQKQTAMAEAGNAVVQNLLGRQTALPTSQLSPTAAVPTQPRIA